MRFNKTIAAAFLALASQAGAAGFATIVPSTVTAGSIATSTITFTVGSGGLAPGSRLEITLPANWGPQPQVFNSTVDGYVSVSGSTGSFVLSSVTTAPVVTAVLNSSFTIPSLATVTFIFRNFYVSCPQSAQNSAVWKMRLAADSTSPLTDLPAFPTQALIDGPPTFLAYQPWDNLNILSGQAATLTLESRSQCGKPAPLTSTMTVLLNGQILTGGTYTSDFSAQFSSGVVFSSTTFLVLQAGSTQTNFYYKTALNGSNLWIRGDYTFPSGTAAQIWRSVSSFAAGSAPAFSALSVDVGAAQAGQTSATLTPDGDGSADIGIVRFVPSTNGQNWRVRISSDSTFASWSYERWGAGDPGGTLNWDGRTFSPTGSAIVPNGTYFVRVEFPGVTINNSLSFVVNTAAISGQVKLSGSPVAGARVSGSAQSGNGYSETRTDASGNYTLNGLRSGAVYSLFCQFASAATGAQLQDRLNNVNSGSSGADFAFVTPGLVRVAATLSAAAPVASFGTVNARTSDYAKFYNGNLRLTAGATMSDNGDAFAPSSWTLLYMAPGSYILDTTVPSYGSNTQNVTVTAGQTQDIIISLAPKATVYGKITLPSAVTQSLWVSVEGTLNGQNFPTVWGGASFNVGQSSAIYTVYSVPAGSWKFRARSSIYQPLEISRTVGTTDPSDPINGGADFSGFITGGQITGTVTITGGLGGLTNLNVGLNAFSNAIGINGYAQVNFSTASTPATVSYAINGLADGTYSVSAYLPGFELSPTGLKTAVVSGGIANLNLTLAQVTGAISGVVTLPGSASDYSQVHLSLVGQGGADGNREADLGSGSYNISNLPSGFYTLTATYRTTGLSARQNLSVSNGATVPLNIDLAGATYNISGTASVISGFTMKTSTGALVTINTLGGLLAAATTQTLIFGGAATYDATGAPACSGGTNVVVATPRVEAFLKDFGSFSNSNRNGFSNCFDYGHYAYGVLDAAGNYTLTGLTPGVWEVSLYPYLDGGTTPNIAVIKQTLTVNSSKTGINFTLGNGSSISGTLFLPAGDTDTRTFDVDILSTRGEKIQSAQLELNSASSASFIFTNLADGSYSLNFRDQGTANMFFGQTAKYVAKPIGFTIQGADLANQNVTVTRASHIVGKLAVGGKNPDGTDALTLITPSNATLLPSGFNISAEAFPWIEGGYQGASQSGSGIDLNADNQFHIDGLVSGIYDVRFMQSVFGADVQAQGGVNLANKTLAQIKVSEGQTLDLGTITLIPGLSLKGSVTDSTGRALANIRVRANASAAQHSDGVEATTDAQGNYVLFGLDAALKIYDLKAAPRPSPGDTTPEVPYGQVEKRAVDVTATSAVNFVLSAANASYSGVVVTEDNGPLGYPQDDNLGFPAAAVYMRLQGTAIQDSDPLGDIQVATDLDGHFAVRHLVPGTYVVQVISLGYRPKRLTVKIAGNESAGTLTLAKGPSLTATLVKPDGSGVNTSDVRSAAAVTADLTSIIFGQSTTDSATRNIRSLKFDGFELNKAYSILLFDTLDNIIQPAEGRGIVFTGNSDTRALTLTYKAGAPTAFINARKSGDNVLVTFYFSRPLRNTQTFDADPANFLTISDGHGTLSSLNVAGDRRSMGATYTPAAGEQTATLSFSAFTTDADVTTGLEAPISKTAILRFGQKATAEKNINSALGGDVTLADNNDPSAVSVPGNALRTTTGDAAGAENSYNISFSATDDIANTAAAAPSARTLSSALTRGARAYFPDAFAAMTAARASASTINPFSAFYSVLLPAGLSHTLNQSATLTLQYSADADPATLNVYYYDGQKYLIESANRTVDTVNRTISVGVSHFSTFVVLQNANPVVTVDGGASSTADIEVFNFPNPFDLTPKVETLSRGGTTATLATDGTVIRYAIPAAKAGAAHIDIFNVVGEKVRSIDLGVPAADIIHYVAWDGKNDSGRKVASGVYVGLCKVGGEKKFWKMAVIK